MPPLDIIVGAYCSTVGRPCLRGETPALDPSGGDIAGELLKLGCGGVHADTPKTHGYVLGREHLEGEESADERCSGTTFFVSRYQAILLYFSP